MSKLNRRFFESRRMTIGHDLAGRVAECAHGYDGRSLREQSLLFSSLEEIMVFIKRFSVRLRGKYR